MTKWWKCGLAAILSGLLLAGCSDGGASGGNETQGTTNGVFTQENSNENVENTDDGAKNENGGSADTTDASEEETTQATPLKSEVADEEFKNCEVIFLNKVTMNYEDASFFIYSPKPENVDIYSYVITFDDSYSLYNSLKSLLDLKPRYKDGAVSTDNKVYWIYDDESRTTGFEFGYFAVPEGTDLADCELYLDNTYGETEATKALPTDLDTFDFSEYADRLVQLGGHYFAVENIATSDGVGGDDIYYSKSFSKTLNYICLDDLTFELDPERFQISFDMEISDSDKEMLTTKVQKNNVNTFNIQQFKIGFSLKSDAERYETDEEYEEERDSLGLDLFSTMQIGYQE